MSIAFLFLKVIAVDNCLQGSIIYSEPVCRHDFQLFGLYQPKTDNTPAYLEFQNFMDSNVALKALFRMSSTMTLNFAQYLKALLILGVISETHHCV